MSPGRRAPRGLLVLLLGVVLAVIVAPYTFLPPLLEGAVAQDLRSRLGTDEPPEVTLESEPRWRMLAGDFSGGRVELGSPEVSGIRPDSVGLVLDPFDVRVLESLYVRTLRTERPISGTVEARFSERTLSRIAEKNAGEYPLSGVALRDGLLFVETRPDVLGIVVPLSVGGTPDVQSNDFVFRPREVRAMGVPIPEEITDKLLEGATFRYPLGGLPYGDLIEDARVQDGRLVVRGSVPDINVEAR